MNNIKKQFELLIKNIPKRIQIILLFVICILFIIFIILFFSASKSKKDIVINDLQAQLFIEPDIIDWSKTLVNSEKKQKITLKSDYPVKIISVKWKEKNDLLEPKTSCLNLDYIDKDIECFINIEFNPKSNLDIESKDLIIEWRSKNAPDKMIQISNVKVVVGSYEESLKQKTKIEDIKESKLEEKKDDLVESKKEDITIDKDKSELVLDVSFDNYNEKESDILKTDNNTNKNTDTKDSSKENDKLSLNSCSDFAFVGYNQNGKEIGWIKPDAGNYKFYLFEDKNCSNPKGIYNPDSGIIFDIKDLTKKIGSDAENIGKIGLKVGNTIPELSNLSLNKTINKAKQLESLDTRQISGGKKLSEINNSFVLKSSTEFLPSSDKGKNLVVSSAPYDRTFVLRQYKPIPATIVSEIRAVKEQKFPVTATVDRHVYSDNGRIIILPAGTMILGYLEGNVPGPYKSVGRVDIKWYSFIRPDGVEFHFKDKKPFAADSQGRVGVPGHGSTDYLEQFVMPLLTAIVPVGVNMIAPIADQFVNKIDLDKNIVTQQGQVRSSELAKNEIIKTWNQIAQKLMVDMMDNTVPPFSVAAGTRITIYSPTDLLVTCGTAENNPNKKCAIKEYSKDYATLNESANITIGEKEYQDSLLGQVRSFNLSQYCNEDGSVDVKRVNDANIDYRTVLFYCKSQQYSAKNNARQEAIFKNQKENAAKIDEKKHNEDILNLNYLDKEKTILENPFSPLSETEKCNDGTLPDSNGCCTGETYTDMGESGWNCCPNSGGDCFPPMKKQ